MSKGFVLKVLSKRFTLAALLDLFGLIIVIWNMKRFMWSIEFIRIGNDTNA